MDIKKLNTTMKKDFHAAGAKGAKVVFALIDTGVAPLSAFNNHVFKGNTNGLSDTNGHGTFIASQLLDMCPEAQIQSWNCMPNGAGSMNDIISALYDVRTWATANPTYQYIVNLSLSGECDGAIKAQFEKAIDDLVAINVPVFCAAGNDGEQRLNKYPSCFQSPICVSALNQDGKFANYSTWHNEVDFAEWGTNCTGLSPKGKTVTMSGTSMACPNVAAKAGLLCSWHHKKYGKWPKEPDLFEMLKSMAQDLGSAGFDPYFGWGFVQLDRASQADKKEEPTMAFDYVTDLGLVWPNGRNKRSVTDHVQIHHTVGDFSTPTKWKNLHKHRIEDSGYLGIEYSFGVCPDGTIYEGRGLEYKHGAVKNSKTMNEKNIGAADRSVSVTLIGDMRDKGMPTEKQWNSAVRLVKDIVAKYKLPASAVLGHDEIPLYTNNKPTGKTYDTLCPCIDMDKFRAEIAGTAPSKPDPVQPEPEPEPTEDEALFPYLGKYTGSTYVNVRSGAGTQYTAVGKFTKGEKCVVLDEKSGWSEIVLYEQTPLVRGWCVNTYLQEV